MIASDVLAAARAWREADPDPATCAELDGLLAAATAGDEAALGELAARFAGRLQFGTAGLRGALGAGPMRMNRLVVRQAAAGLGRWVLDQGPAAAERGVAIGFDARRNSDVFALDTALVLAALGVRAHLFPAPCPTPVLAFGVRHLAAAAGVMVTASHNPPADNGYKVYLSDGAQIVDPVDREISDRIDAVERPVALAAPDHRLVHRLGHEVTEAYLDHVATVPFTTRRDVRVAYTAMHGVGRDTLVAAFERCGFPPPHQVVEQADPDPAFPTVAFPNPEEPGAMDLLLATARAVGADVALANDPDADRLGVAIPDQSAEGGWRALNGNEIGWLLADHVLAHTAGDDRLVVTTVVSSRLLARMAADHGVHATETLTGFKWIAEAVRRLEPEGRRFVFGYEEALGYLVDPAGRDKDGISAALLFAELVAGLSARGSSVAERLDELAARYGRHRTVGWSLRADQATIAGVLQRLRATPPAELGGHAVTAVAYREAADLLSLELGDAGRVLVRPSGTEPKCKVYVETVDADPGPVLADVRRRMEA